MARKLSVAVLALIVGAIILVEISGVDASAPSWMRPLIDDGRASLYENLDMIDPGSPLTFTHARCRGDGAMLLFFTNRWLWVSPSFFVVDVPATWERDPRPRSFGGGVAEALTIEYGEDLEDYFEADGEITCTATREAAS